MVVRTSAASKIPAVADIKLALQTLVALLLATVVRTVVVVPEWQGLGSLTAESMNCLLGEECYKAVDMGTLKFHCLKELQSFGAET